MSYSISFWRGPFCGAAQSSLEHVSQEWRYVYCVSIVHPEVSPGILTVCRVSPFPRAAGRPLALSEAPSGDGLLGGEGVVWFYETGSYEIDRGRVTTQVRIHCRRKTLGDLAQQAHNSNLLLRGTRLLLPLKNPQRRKSMGLSQPIISSDVIRTGF